MRRPSRGCRCTAVLLGMALVGSVRAEEKKEKQVDAKPEPPRVALVIPLAIRAGPAQVVRLRGQSLTNVTELVFTNRARPATARIKSSSRVEVPKESDTRKVGDTQIEVELQFPPDAAGTTNTFVVLSPAGRSEPASVLVLSESALVDEQEPNGGYKNAQIIPAGCTVQGGIKDAGDVDVFRFSGRRGQPVRLSIVAASLGSSLDSILTLSDRAGHTLASADDVDGALDASLTATLPADGDYFVTVSDAHDKGGVGHVYLLRVMAGP